MRRPTDFTKKFPDQAADVRFNLSQLESRIDRNNPTGCWLVVTGGFHRQGYGMISAYRIRDQQRIMATAHRVMLKYHLQQDCWGQNVIHSCGRLNCCNPEHLFLGTARDVSQTTLALGKKDYCARGLRRERQQGRRYKLTTEQLVYIRDCTVPEVQARFPSFTEDFIQRWRRQLHSNAYRQGLTYAWLHKYSLADFADK